MPIFMSAIPGSTRTLRVKLRSSWADSFQPGQVWFKLVGTNKAGIVADAAFAMSKEDAIKHATQLLTDLAPDLLAPRLFLTGQYVANYAGASNPRVYRLVSSHVGGNGGEWWGVQYNAGGQINHGEIQIDRKGSDFRRVEVKVTPATPEVWEAIDTAAELPE